MLEWVTPKENTEHSFKFNKDRRIYSRVVYVYKNNVLFKKFESVKSCSLFFKISHSTVILYIQTKNIYRKQYTFEYIKNLY